MADEEEDEVDISKQLAQAWRLSQAGCWISAQQIMAGLPDQEVTTDDDLEDGAELPSDDEPSSVSTEGNVPAAEESSGEEGEGESDEDVEEPTPSPARVAIAQASLFSAMGDALSVEVDRGTSASEAVERLESFAALALERSPLDLSKPRGLRAPLGPPPPPPWRDESGALVLPSPHASSEAARFFVGASAAEPAAADAAVARVAVAEAVAGMEAEAATDDESETVLSDRSDGSVT